MLTLNIFHGHPGCIHARGTCPAVTSTPVLVFVAFYYTLNYQAEIVRLFREQHHPISFCGVRSPLTGQHNSVINTG